MLVLVFASERRDSGFDECGERGGNKRENRKDKGQNTSALNTAQDTTLSNTPGKMIEMICSQRLRMLTSPAWFPPWCAGDPLLSLPLLQSSGSGSSSCTSGLPPDPAAAGDR